ncbi:MAG TPA: VOC family protein [Hyphomicrobiaceae bacterium]|jgi:uncharacterized glyoxalase superfamily protein PhnB
MVRATAITPVLRYRDVGAASRWLCEAFGFQEHNRAQELGGYVRYVSLRLGDSFVLVRPVANSILDHLMVQPEAVGGANTQICYLTIANAADHCAHAEAAGATIELEPQDDGLGGRFYTCRDLEGHLWSFGTQTYGIAHGATSAFEPAELSPSLPRAGIALPRGDDARKPARRSRLLREIGVAAATGVLVSAGWLYFDTYSASRNKETISAPMAARLKETAEQLAHERSRRLVAEEASKKVETILAEERTVAVELRKGMQRAQAALADIRQEKDQAVRALKSSNELLQEHRLARDRAEAETAVAKTKIAEAETKLAKTAETEAQLARLQQDTLMDKEELQKARTALLAAKRQNEELLARFEPAVSNARPIR